MRAPIFGAVLLAFVLTIAGPASAAPPTVVPMQGILSDPFDVTLEGPVPVHFALYTTTWSDTTLWEEDQVLYLEGGRFVAYLGAEVPLDPALFEASGSLYLGITVADDPQEMPRVRLGSVPYALHAQSCAEVPAHTHPAAELQGVVQANTSCQPGQVVTGFDAAGLPQCTTVEGGTGGNYALASQTCPTGQYVIGINTSGQIICAVPPGGGTGGGDITGSGSSDKLAVWTSTTSLGSSIITDTGTRIGIDDNYPDVTLDVGGNARVDGDLEVEDDFLWGGNAFSSSSCIYMGGSSCSSACGNHGMSCYKALSLDDPMNGSDSCSQSGFKICCCRN